MCIQKLGWGTKYNMFPSPQKLGGPATVERGSGHRVPTHKNYQFTTVVLFSSIVHTQHNKHKQQQLSTYN